MEIVRSKDGRWSIERHVDRYIMYDELAPDPTEEVWSCRTLTQVYEWIERMGMRPSDFEEVYY